MSAFGGSALFSQMSSIGLVLLLVQVSKRFDLTDPAIIAKIRIVYLAAQAVYISLCLLIRYIINRKNDTTTFTYAPAQSPFSMNPGAAPSITVTVRDYDLGENRKQLQQTVLSTVVMMVLHFKFGFVQPMIFQSIPPLKQLLESHLTKIHLFGCKAEGDLKRPFKVPSPFEALLNGPSANENGNSSSEVNATANNEMDSAMERVESEGTNGVKFVESETETASSASSPALEEMSETEKTRNVGEIGNVKSRKGSAMKSRRDL